MDLVVCLLVCAHALHQLLPLLLCSYHTSTSSHSTPALAFGNHAGEAVKSSGLLVSIAQGITELTEGMDLTEVLLIFCMLVLLCTTFISHTVRRAEEGTRRPTQTFHIHLSSHTSFLLHTLQVGAMVILPIVQKVGEEMPGGHPKLLVMATALMCSGAMGLPVSGFPNM